MFRRSANFVAILALVSCLLVSCLCGQTPNDQRDDTAWLQARLDDLTKPSTTDRAPFAAGKYIVRQTLKLGPTMGLRLSGAGGHDRSPNAGWDAVRTGTIFEWHGEPGGTILDTSGCTGLVVEGINFQSRDADAPAGIGVLIRHGRGALNIAFRDCGFSELAVGIQCGTTWGEGTCANVTYDNCHFEFLSEAGVRLVNAQSLEHLFLRPEFAWLPRCIDVQGGGDVTVLGGGTYEVGTLLHLNRIGGNASGFDVHSVRFDGRNRKRSAWLTVADTDRPQGYGVITFRDCTQNDGQRGDTSQPLVTVPPGARVLLESCGFRGAMDNWAEVWGSTRPLANGELVIEHCDGVGPAQFPTLVRAKSARAFYEFIRCGPMWGGQRGSFSTFP